MNNNEAESSGQWLPRRKKIVAREVARPASQDAVNSSPAMEEGDAPEQVVVTPASSYATTPQRRGEAVLDPTLFGERHRKHSHNFAYHMTQFATLATLLAATGSLACQLLDEPVSARLCAIASVLLAVASLRLVRMTRLSSRLRGYAVGAGVLAGIALAITLAMMIWNDDSPTPSHRIPSTNPPVNLEETRQF